MEYIVVVPVNDGVDFIQRIIATDEAILLAGSTTWSRRGWQTERASGGGNMHLDWQGRDRHAHSKRHAHWSWYSQVGLKEWVCGEEGEDLAGPLKGGSVCAKGKGE